MPKFHEAKLNAEGKKFALIVSRFNDFITEKLLSGALDALVRSGAADEDLEVVKVPGAFEIPQVAKKMVGLDGYGLRVIEQVPIEVAPNEFNKCYLECKKIKMGHMLNADASP